MESPFGEALNQILSMATMLVNCIGMLTQPEHLKKELTDQKWGYLKVSLNVCCLTGDQDKSISQAQGLLLFC